MTTTVKEKRFGLWLKALLFCFLLLSTFHTGASANASKEVDYNIDAAFSLTIEGDFERYTIGEYQAGASNCYKELVESLVNEKRLLKAETIIRRFKGDGHYYMSHVILATRETIAEQEYQPKYYTFLYTDIADEAEHFSKNLSSMENARVLYHHNFQAWNGKQIETVVFETNMGL